MVGRLPCETPEAHPARDQGGSIAWVLPATILGSSLSFIDGSVVNVALPAMQRDFQAQLATMQWIVNGYMLMLASLILPGGSAGDRFGRRRVFLIGLTGFAATSLACGLAPTVQWLVAARFAQGITAALLVPSSLAIIGASYAGEARGRAIGTWAGAAALTTALGPPLGGWLVDVVSWRAVFYVNLPIATIACVMALKIPADRGTSGEDPIDLAGTVLAVVALGLISYGLIALGRNLRLIGVSALLAAVPAIALCIRQELRARAPVLPPGLFASREFAGANGLTVLLYAALSGALFLLPFLLINHKGYSAMAAGAALLPFSAIMGAGSRTAGGLVKRWGPRTPLSAGALISACAYALLALSGGDKGYWTGFLPGLVVLGIGMTLAVAPLTTTVFDSAPKDKSGVASGVNNAAARAGGLIAVAALGLAFGGTAASSIEPSALPSAYRLVMWVASGLAALSALIAAATVRSGVAAGASHRAPF
ncbi:MAG TPA: MFS transporter [Casimicrobiaceae bacterium]|nr:MFS transporter [Casimicrobiaceae bacterium]